MRFEFPCILCTFTCFMEDFEFPMCHLARKCVSGGLSSMLGT